MMKWEAGVLAQLPDPGMPFGLDLYGTQVTDAGVAELQKALPGCRIFR